MDSQAQCCAKSRNSGQRCTIFVYEPSGVQEGKGELTHNPPLRSAKNLYIGKLVHVRVLYPSCAFIPGMFIAGRGGRIRALVLLVLETGTNACTRRVRFSFQGCNFQIIGPKLT